MTPDERRYYATQSRVSDPEDRGTLLAALPAEPAGLVPAISGLVLHTLVVRPLRITAAGPREAVLVAGEVWRRVRAGAVDAATCGVSSVGVGGHGFIAASVARDPAALNKREMLAWDVWGLPLGSAPAGRYRKTRLAAWPRWPPCRPRPSRTGRLRGAARTAPPASA